MSPIFKQNDGFTFRVFSNEESRLYIYVLKGKKEAKIWLEPVIKLQYNKGYWLHEINKILLIVNETKNEFKQKYYQYIG